MTNFDPLLPIGGLGMFLLGMHIMTSGLRSMAGDSIAKALRRSTRSPVSGAMVGTLTTALVQSSSATTVATVGFVSAGVLTFAQALGIIFGANVGTTVTGWIVALLGFKLDLVRLAMPLIFAGIALRLARSESRGGLGFALAGFGLLFVGIGTLQDGFAFIHEALDPSWLPGDGLGGRIAMVGLGAALTTITQSSSAGVAFALAAVHAGAIPFEHAAAAVIGMDIGSSATAMIASVGASTQGRRTAVAHLVFNFFTAVLALLLLPIYLWALGEGRIAGEPELALVGFHTCFNLAATMVGIPLARPFAELIERIVPERGADALKELDSSLLSAPELAVEAAHRAAERVQRRLFDAVGQRLTRGGTVPGDAERRRALGQLDDFIDQIVTSPRATTLHRRHRNLIHALDHMHRLARRLERGRVPEPGPHELRDLVVGAGEAVLEVDPQDLGQRFADLLHREADMRDRLMEQVATGEFDRAAALRELDAGRSLRRTLLHAHRISALLSEPTEAPETVQDLD